MSTGSCATSRAPALILGLITFGNKLASGLGKVVSGWILEWVGFPDVKSGVAVTPEGGERPRALCRGVLCGRPAWPAWRSFPLSRLTRARHAEIVAGLRERDRMMQTEPASG